MKRRGFLKGLIGGTASVILPIQLKASEQPVEVNKNLEILELGEIGLQRIDVQGTPFKVSVITPQHDWENDGIIVDTETFVLNWSECSSDRTMFGDTSYVVVVYEASMVHIETKDYGNISFKPEWDKELNNFKPVHYTSNFSTFERM